MTKPLTSSLRRLLTLALIATTLAGPLGCAASRRNRQAEAGVSAYYAGDFEQAQQLLQPLTEIPDSNYVLNNLRLGEAALTAGDLDAAERAYYRAYETLNSAGVNNAARTAATVLFNEKVRIWLGEPYERAVANFQLGLVYYLKADYANARGAFENSLFKLRRFADEEDAESDFEEQESTFAVAYLMLGRCHQNLGREDLARQSFKRAVELDPSLAAAADPELNAASNVLLVVAWGRGPEKVAEGSGLRFATSTVGGGRLPRPRVSVDGLGVEVAERARPTIDTNLMASQRRWQTTDTFRAAKAVAGTGLLYGGLIALDQGARRNNSDAALIGVAAIGLGALLSASSAPDTRQWEMVPRTIYVVPMVVEPGVRDISVALPDAAGSGLLVREFRGVPVPSSGEVALYARMLRSGPSVTTFGAEPELDTDYTD